MNKNNSGSSWFVLVNPVAGSGEGEKDWDKISCLLGQNGFSFTHQFTLRKYHAIELVTEAVNKGTDKIIVIGGDGTLNEAVNGIFAQSRVATEKVLLGMIPVGTGNDWGRMFHIPSDYEEAIRILKKGQTFRQDAGLVRYIASGKQTSRYFINIAGLGFDARVVQKANKQKEEGKHGVLLYFLNIFTILMNYKSTRVSIEVDGKPVFENSVLSISLGNGRYAGGGMLQTPGAKPDDGLLDLTVIKDMSKLRVITSLKKLYDGNILDHPLIEGFTGKTIRIDSDPPIYAETDGESLGHTPVEFEILPNCLQVIVEGV